ncbi:hemerythrin domain-containing protein [Vibrio cholerae]|uniref:Hemerythrin domain-containing protein n=1 Tax=Vibrio cholerae TaxID=666 RepID=A0A544EYA4_VIBCL|nr:hemerythrin domain-containing protein [Vibrio cholerae]TQO81274.1 hemerythrin domain-containing protein [Vibrio cholerae]TQP16805.1 hemerythrin domain-containing protein [Vibrio cholerae]TQP26099.1 hemerythrin domain-containing protein [Vibrio cholerae]TQP26333.1 hemerythrin domain-containing protein [Vibrio cholerae]TQP48075.1 hemerythrin domain-containing protein [Vibrio cholerae]
MMMERIRREHSYMVRLLSILRHKLDLVKSEQPINYSLLKEIVDYLASHSEKVHHPKEDILYRHYMAHYGDKQQVANLEREHQELAQITHQFLDVMEMILNDAVVPQDVFIEQLEAFLQGQKQHLELEEQSILPLINQTFELEDWQSVESQWQNNDDDPVFGETIAERYALLARRVRKSESEYT